MIIPDFALIPYSERIGFVNLSGMVELRVRKDRVDRIKKLVKYLRRKLNDKTIYKVIPYENKSYMIIRHPLQDIKEFIQAYDQCIGSDNRVRFINDHIDLFNNLEFVCKFCEKDGSRYQFMPDKFKSNMKLIKAVLSNNSHYYIHFPDRMKNNKKVLAILLFKEPYKFNIISETFKNDRQFIIYILSRGKSFYIYEYLYEGLKKDPEIVSMQLSVLQNDLLFSDVIANIPDNLIKDRNFILSLRFDNIDVSMKFYSHLSTELQRDYDILLKHGYGSILTTYNKIMTPEMKSDIELHRKLVKLNPSIYDLMSEKLKNIIPKN
jgi:hypothetical protein